MISQKLSMSPVEPLKDKMHLNLFLQKGGVFLFVSLLFLLIGCIGPDSLKTTLLPKKVLKRASYPPFKLFDDLDLSSLREALEENLKQLKTKVEAEDKIHFGSFSIEKISYIKSLESLLKVLEENPKTFFSFVKKNFHFYAIHRDRGLERKRRKKNQQKLREEADIFLTSYYLPVIKGSLKKTKVFSQPLYRTPHNLVRLDWTQFMKKRGKEKGGQQTKGYQDIFSSSSSALWGRVSKNGRSQKGEKYPLSFIPFFSRNEIDVQGRLKGKKLELVWVQPVEAFFLHIQGSGVVELENGRRMYLGYHSQNGHPYVPIGRFVNLPKEEINMMSLKHFLKNLSFNERQKIFNLNPSYVFFEKLRGKQAFSSFGTRVIAGRTVATDPRFFPRGSLAYLEFKKPVFSSKHEDSYEKKRTHSENKLNSVQSKKREGIMKPIVWEATSRFVLNQDKGGAIRGAHRLDLFWGEGEGAGFHAGVIQDWGKMYVLVPKKSALK